MSAKERYVCAVAFAAVVCGGCATTDCNPSDRSVLSIASCSSEGYQSRQRALEDSLAAQRAKHRTVQGESDELLTVMQTARNDIAALQADVARIERELAALYATEESVGEMLKVTRANAPVIVDMFERLRRQLNAYDQVAIPSVPGASVRQAERRTLVDEINGLATDISRMNLSVVQAAAVVARWLSKSRLTVIAAVLSGAKGFIDAYVQGRDRSPIMPAPASRQ